MRTAMGPEVWNKTAVVMATEFGRTVHPNGSGGTDHGTGGAAFLFGGAVQGGQVKAEWVGLSSGALKDGRDQPAKTDLRALFKGVWRNIWMCPVVRWKARYSPTARPPCQSRVSFAPKFAFIPPFAG